MAAAAAATAAAARSRSASPTTATNARAACSLSLVAGRAAPLDVFELVGLRAAVSGEALRVAESYTAAFEAFLRREFAEASRLLKQPFLSADKPSQVLRARIEQETSSPTETGWEGVNRFEEK